MLCDFGSSTMIACGNVQAVMAKNNEKFSWLKRNSNRTIPDEEIGLMETDFGTF